MLTIQGKRVKKYFSQLKDGEIFLDKKNEFQSIIGIKNGEAYTLVTENGKLRGEYWSCDTIPENAIVEVWENPHFHLENPLHSDQNFLNLFPGTIFQDEDENLCQYLGYEYFGEGEFYHDYVVLSPPDEKNKNLAGKIKTTTEDKVVLTFTEKQQ